MNTTDPDLNLSNQQKARQLLTAWYDSDVGYSALVYLKQNVRRITSDIFGYYSLEIGLLAGHSDLLATSRIRHRFSIGLDDKGGNVPFDLRAHPEALPLQQGSVDLVVASHILEWANSPHTVLREIERVLMPEGHCVLLAFNPLSFRGLGLYTWQLFKPSSATKIKFYTPRRLREWFEVLGFEVIETRHIGFQSNIGGAAFARHTRWLDGLGKMLRLPFGNVCIIHAQKKVASVTLLKTKYHQRILTPAPGMVVNSGSSKDPHPPTPSQPLKRGASPHRARGVIIFL